MTLSFPFYFFCSFVFGQQQQKKILFTSNIWNRAEPYPDYNKNPNNTNNNNEKKTNKQMPFKGWLPFENRVLDSPTTFLYINVCLTVCNTQINTHSLTDTNTFILSKWNMREHINTKRSENIVVRSWRFRWQSIYPLNGLLRNEKFPNTMQCINNDSQYVTITKMFTSPKQHRVTND